jgi:DNA-binding MarR family transcriptional regulator
VADNPGLWVSVSELARLRGNDKSVISRRIKRLEEQGALQTRPGAGGAKLVCLAEYDRASEEGFDAVRALDASTGSDRPPQEAAAPGDPVLAKEQARRAGYAADLAQLDLHERLGELGRVAGFRQSMRTCAEGVVQVLEQLPGRAEEIAGAVRASDSLAQVRGILRALVRDVRDQLDRGMASIIELEREKEAEAAASSDEAG